MSYPKRRRSDHLLPRLYDMALRSDLVAIRLVLAFGAVLIGLGFLWPVPVFPTAAQLAAGTGRHTYALMAQMAPEWVWGTAFFVQGALMLWCLLIDYHNKYLLWIDACFGSLLWTLAVGARYVAYWQGFDNIMTYRPPAIMGGEVAVAIASWWCFVRYSFGDDRRG